MRILEDLKQDVEDLWDSATEGWRRLRHQAAGALTRFRPGAKSPAPDIRNDFNLPPPGWALLAGDVFEDSKKIVVRLEVPGMDKSDFDIEARDDVLIVRGEKRFESESESGDGRYRVLQCAYGSFSRTIPLPATIIVDQANATYLNGVLKVELTKAEPTKTREVQIKVS